MKAVVVLLGVAFFLTICVQADQSSRRHDCAMCDLLANSVYNSEAQNDFTAGIEAITRCAMFGTKKDQCARLMTKITGPLRAAKNTGVPVNSACTHIGTCPRATDERLSDMTSTRSAMKASKASVMSSTLFSKATRAEALPLVKPILEGRELENDSVLDGRFCGMCELLVAMVQNYIAAPSSSSNVQHVLLEFCNGLAPPSNALCAYTVNNFLPKIIHSLENQNLPNTICAELQLCDIN